MYHCISTTHPIHSWSKKAPTPHSQTLQPSLAVRHYGEYQVETRDIYRVSQKKVHVVPLILGYPLMLGVF